MSGLQAVCCLQPLFFTRFGMCAIFARDRADNRQRWRTYRAGMAYIFSAGVFAHWGEEVVNGADSEIVVDVNGWAQGMYFVLVEGGGDVAARLRFVKK